MVVKPRFAEAGDFVSGFAPVAMYFGPDEDDCFVTRWGFIDRAGRMLDTSNR